MNRFRFFRFTPVVLGGGAASTISGATVTWNFGDGTIRNSNRADGSIEHEFSSSTNAQEFTVTCTISFNNVACTKTVQKGVTVAGCGVQRDDRDEVSFNSNNTRKLYSLIWMDETWFSSSVGAKALFYRKRWIGWGKETADEMTIKWTDNSRFIINCVEEKPLGFTTLTASGKTEVRDDRNRFSASTDVSGRPNTIDCDFRVSDEGTVIGPIRLSW